MGSVDDPYRAAATLALDLLTDSPSLDDVTAADAAWHAFREHEAPGPRAMFQSGKYRDDVMRMMEAIRGRTAERIEHSPPMLEKARKCVAEKGR